MAGLTAADWRELSDGLANAARVTWRWLRDDKSPWERHVTVRMVERLSRASAVAAEEAALTARSETETPAGSD